MATSGASFAEDLWDAPRAQRPEWAAMLAEVRAGGGLPPVAPSRLYNASAQALLRAGGDPDSPVGRAAANRFLVFLSSTFTGDLGGQGKGGGREVKGRWIWSISPEGAPYPSPPHPPLTFVLFFKGPLRPQHPGVALGRGAGMPCPPPAPRGVTPSPHTTGWICPPFAAALWVGKDSKKSNLFLPPSPPPQTCTRSATPCTPTCSPSSPSCATRSASSSSPATWWGRGEGGGTSPGTQSPPPPPLLTPPFQLSRVS